MLGRRASENGRRTVGAAASPTSLRLGARERLVVGIREGDRSTNRYFHFPGGSSRKYVNVQAYCFDVPSSPIPIL